MFSIGSTSNLLSYNCSLDMLLHDTYFAVVHFHIYQIGGHRIFINWQVVGWLMDYCWSSWAPAKKKRLESHSGPALNDSVELIFSSFFFFKGGQQSVAILCHISKFTLGRSNGKCETKNHTDRSPKWFLFYVYDMNPAELFLIILLFILYARMIFFWQVRIGMSFAWHKYFVMCSGMICIIGHL